MSGGKAEGFLQRMRLDGEPAEKIDPRAWKVWTIHGAISSAVVAAMAAAFIVWGMPLLELEGYYAWLAAGLAIVNAIWSIAVSPWLTMRFWRYEVREDELETQHGVFIIKRHLVPMVRVQHVDTEHGPLMRYFGLATLYVSTAATRFPIPALPRQKAEELRGEISALARVSDEDV